MKRFLFTAALFAATLFLFGSEAEARCRQRGQFRERVREFLQKVLPPYGDQVGRG